MKLIKKEELKKEFNELIKEQGLSVDEAIDKLYKKISSENQLLIGFNGVYVYMGTYKLVHESSTSWYPVKEVLVSEKDPTAEYKLYYEIDTGLPKYVKIEEELKDFEQKNKIVHIPNPRSFEYSFTFEEDYKKLRKLYLRTLCLEGEEAAIASITSEDYIKQIFSVEKYMKKYNLDSSLYQEFFDAALCNTKGSSSNTEKRVAVKKKTYTSEIKTQN